MAQMREPRFVEKILMCICQPVLTFVLMLLFNATFSFTLTLAGFVQCLNVYCSVLLLLLSFRLNNHDSMSITYGNGSTVLFSALVLSLSSKAHAHTHVPMVNSGKKN